MFAPIAGRTLYIVYVERNGALDTVGVHAFRSAALAHQQQLEYGRGILALVATGWQ